MTNYAQEKQVPMKTRVWDVTAGKMLFFTGIFNNHPYTEKSSFPQYESCKEYHELRYSRFTGLYDKNGKEMYEGDIIRGEDGYNREIIYGTMNCGCCYSVYGFALDPFDYEDFVFEYPEQYEVIGNIYENPELIKEIP